jgi:hypothetical protein
MDVFKVKAIQDVGPKLIRAVGILEKIVCDLKIL